MSMLFTGARLHVTGTNGKPLAGGWVYTYASGTTTPKVTYNDAGKTSAKPNPFQLDAYGEATVWLDGAYKINIEDASHSQLPGYPVDPVTSVVGSASDVLYIQSGTGAVPFPAQDKMREAVSVKDFGAVGDGVADDSAAFVKAAAASATVTVPARFNCYLATDVNTGSHFILYGTTSGPGRINSVTVRHGSTVFAVGRNADNLAKGLQVGGGDPSDGTDGVVMAPDGYAAWLRFQPSKNESPIELVIYPSASQGVATATIGTSTLTRVSGSAFQSSWVDKKIYFGPAVYRVLTVPDANTMTVANVLGGTVPFASTFNETFHIAYFSGTGSCTVAGGVVTRLAGDPFIPFVASPYVFKLNGTAYTVTTFTNIDTQTISSPPANGTYTYVFETDINDQLSTVRVQKMYGSSEENLSIYANYKGYHLRSFFAGSGQLRPIFIGNSSFTNAVFYADGSTSIGAEQGAESVRFLASLGTPVNRLEVQAAATGFDPTWRARGLDVNVGMGFDTQGTGAFKFTSHNLTNTEFQIFGVGGASWLAVQSDNFLQPTMSAQGAGANIDVKLAPKGAGLVWLTGWTANADAPVNGYIQVKDAAGNTRKIATIA